MQQVSFPSAAGAGSRRMAGLGFRPLFTEGPGAYPIYIRPVQNIKRDPFGQAVGESQQTVNGIGGALGGPLTAFLYNWNMLPIGQLLWEKELESYKEFPPLQAPKTYNLTGILDGDEEGWSSKRLTA